MNKGTVRHIIVKDSYDAMEFLRKEFGKCVKDLYNIDKSKIVNFNVYYKFELEESKNEKT